MNINYIDFCLGLHSFLEKGKETFLQELCSLKRMTIMRFA